MTERDEKLNKEITTTIRRYVDKSNMGESDKLILVADVLDLISMAYTPFENLKKAWDSNVDGPEIGSTGLNDIDYSEK